MQHWFTYPTNVDPVAIHLGPINIHCTGISYLIGFVCVFLWMTGRRRRGLGLTTEQIQDFLFYALIGVLVAARTFFVINDIVSKHDASFYFQQADHFIAVWNGGMAFHAAWSASSSRRALRSQASRPDVSVLATRSSSCCRSVSRSRHRELRQRRALGRRLLAGPSVVHDSGNVATWGSSYRHPAQLYEAALDLLTLPFSSGCTGASQRRRGRVDLVYDLRRHALGGRALAASRLHVARNHRRQLYALPMIAIGIAMTRVVQSPQRTHRPRARLART